MSAVHFTNVDSPRQFNRSLILKEIRQNGPITKIDLAERYDLTFTAVGNIVFDLSEAGIVEKAGYGESSGGRPPVLYQIKWDSVYVVALVIGVKGMTVSLVNLKGEVRDESTSHVESHLFVDKAYELIDHLLAETPIDTQKIAGICVTAPGPLDVTDGRLLSPPNLSGVHNLDIREMIEKRYGWTTILEKDANAFALAEQWFGHVKPNENILYIYNDQGLGSGMIIDSHIHRGFGNGAGEIGHMVIDIDGPKCSCGNYGCLETLSSGIAVERRVKEEIRRGYPSTLAHGYLHDEKEPTIDMIVKEARQGDALSIQVLKEAERYLGLGIANAINLFSPNQIVFGGQLTRLYPEMIEGAEKVAKARAFSPISKKVIFTASAFNNQSTTIGAAAVIQQKWFDESGGIIA